MEPTPIPQVFLRTPFGLFRPASPVCPFCDLRTSKTAVSTDLPQREARTLPSAPGREPLSVPSGVLPHGAGSLGHTGQPDVICGEDTEPHSISLASREAGSGGQPCGGPNKDSGQ